MSNSVGGLLRWLPDARAGSADALGCLLDACRNYLRLVAERELDPALRAKGGVSDIVQETLIDALRDFGRFRGDSEEELLAWLRRLLLNNLVSFTRRYRQTDKRQVAREVSLTADSSAPGREELLPAMDASPSDRLMAVEDAEALRRTLSLLPGDYRQVLLLRYQDELSFEVIGERMQLTANAARKLLLRAVKRLQQETEGTP